MNINLTDDEADVLRAMVSYLTKEKRFTAAMEEADLEVDDGWEALCSIEEKLYKAILTALRSFAEQISKSSEKDYPDLEKDT